MKKLIFILICAAALSSCATIFCGSKKKVTIHDDNVRVPVDLTVDGARYDHVYLPQKVKVKRGFTASTVTAEAEGYDPCTLTISKKFNGVAILNLGQLIGWGIDAATGAMMKPEQNDYYLHMQKSKGLYDNYVELLQQAAVTRDKPGETALEQTIIRWFIDSDPQGARIFYRVISSVPAEVKNTNETYLMTTPYEETRSFNIQGLTYENSRDVQIEFKIVKQGYEPQVKRFNVRQAIDQQEISSFFMLVPRSE